MNRREFHVLATVFFGLPLSFAGSSRASAQTDPLPSWNEALQNRRSSNSLTVSTRPAALISSRRRTVSPRSTMTARYGLSSPCIGINGYIGHRPIVAFGNSDGDLEMLQWTTLTDGVRFGMIIHHTDADREYAYDRQSHFGHLDVALDQAAINKWTVVDMKRDWKIIFPFQKQ